ncbi:MAG: DUF255 domain-containing protein [Haloferacaceae archaeon]
MTEDSRVEWREWGSEAFETAAAEGKPVLLSLTATWCSDCHEMDRETYDEPRIAANVNDRFVPVRVDVDRHPRVRERYNMGGFPSTVFTTPDGRLLTGATYLGPQGMRQVLDSVSTMWAEKGAEAGRVPRALADDPTPAGEVTPTIEEHLAGQLGEKFDEQYAGWGEAQKFPLPRTIEFALKREREQALRTLDAIRDHLYDDVAGGFFRYAGRRDWGDVAYEKLLEPNAALVRAFANAYLYTGEEVYREPAERTISYLTGDLWNGAAVGGSQGPAGGAEYYGADAADRAERPGPRTDLTAFAGGNAMAAEALLTYVAYTDDERAREYAVRVLEYLRDDLLDGGAVVHYRTREETGESGVLADQARVASAFARASEVLGGDYLETARAVADHAIEQLHESGSFRDGPAAGPGLLDRPLRPLDDNVELADALLDLAVLADEERYREVARETVGAFAGAWDRIGVQVAGYGAVAARLCRDPLVIAVADDPGSDLHRAALRVADHEKVVVPDAARRTDAFERGRAYVRQGGDARAADSPDELMQRVAQVSGE